MDSPLRLENKIGVQTPPSVRAEDAELEGWLGVCQAAIFLTILRAVQSAEEPQVRATIISDEVQEWSLLMSNYISSSLSLFLTHRHEKLDQSPCSTADVKYETFTHEGSSERVNEESVCRAQWKKEKAALEEKIKSHKKEVENLEKVETAIRERVKAKEETLLELKKSIAECYLTLNEKAKIVKEIAISTPSNTQKRGESVLKKLNESQDSSGVLTSGSKTDLSPDTLNGVHDSQLKNLKKRSRNSFPVSPPAAGDDGSSEDQLGWDECSLYNEEEKLVICQNDIENNKQLLRILEEKVSELQCERDEVTASYNDRKKELNDIEEKLVEKQQQLLQITESIREKEQYLLQAPQPIPSTVEVQLPLLESNQFKDKLHSETDEALQKKQYDLLWVSAEIQKKEELVDVYAEKIVTLNSYVQTLHRLLNNTERRLEYLEKCQVSQEETFEQVCQEIKLKSTQVHDLQEEIDHLKHTLAEITAAVSAEEEQLTDLVVSEKILQEKVHSEEEKKDEISRVCDRLSTEKEKLEQVLEKLRAQEHEQQGRLLKLLQTNEAVVYQQKQHERLLEHDEVSTARVTSASSFSKERTHLQLCAEEAKAITPLHSLLSPPTKQPRHMTVVHDVRSSFFGASSQGRESKNMKCVKSNSEGVIHSNEETGTNELMMSAHNRNAYEMQRDSFLSHHRSTLESGGKINYEPPSPYNMSSDVSPFLSIPSHEAQLLHGEERQAPSVDSITFPLRRIQEQAHQLRDASSSGSGEVQTPRAGNADRFQFLPPHLRHYIHVPKQYKEESRTSSGYLHTSSPSLGNGRRGHWGLSSPLAGGKGVIHGSISASFLPVGRQRGRKEKDHLNSHGMHTFSTTQSIPLLYHHSSSSDMSRIGGVESIGSCLSSNLFPKSPPPTNPELQRNHENDMVEDEEYQAESKHIFPNDLHRSIPITFPSPSPSVTEVAAPERTALTPISDTMGSNSLDTLSISEGAAGKLMEEISRMHMLANVSQTSNTAKKSVRSEIA